jgi:hypothetical protein
MNSPATDLKNLILTQSGMSGTFGGIQDWSLYIHAQPDQPDRCITLRDYTSEQRTRFADTSKSPVEYLMVQVLVRSRTYQEGYNKINDIIDFLDQHDRFSVTSDERTQTYKGIFLLSGPIPLQQDEEKRYSFTANFRTVREETTT